MQKRTLSSIVLLAAFVSFAPNTHAYVFRNTQTSPLYGPDFRRGFEASNAIVLPQDDYYGVPEAGVQRLRNDDRNQILQDLQQRVINLQKIRKQPGIEPQYDTTQRVYERLLRRIGEQGIEHYRAPKQTDYRLVWRNNQLIRVPRLTPENIQEAVDAYEHVREVLGSPEDECRRYSGSRQATCRYQQRVNDRINN